MSHPTLWSVPVVVALVLLSLPGQACEYANCHSTGAVTKPSGWDISLPFAEGEQVEVLSGYGPNAGSSLHCRAQDSYCANDYYALDFVLPNHSNYGKGQPVLAIAGGTVLDAGWGTSGWAAYGRRVYIEHNVNGHTYVSMYAHLNSLSVSTGQQVSQGDVLGTLGGSCNGADSCSNFYTPHLHFSIHQDSGFGGSGSGGSYGGRAVIPEPMDGTTGLQQGQVLTSLNGASAPPPPPLVECEQVIVGETVIEDDGGCMSLTGGALTDAEGHGGHAYATTQDNPSPDYADGGVWQLDFAEAGPYALWAHIPATVTNLTPLAEYKVSFDGQASLVQLDQASAAGTWAYLGTFAFAVGDGQWVRLGDNYGDPGTQGSHIVLDALRVVPSNGCECTDPLASDVQPCGEGGTQTRSCDGCYWTSWSQCSEPPSGSSSGSGGSDAGDDEPRATGDDTISAGGLEGTVCSTRPGPTRLDDLALFALSAAALALATRSTRRRGRRHL